MNTPGMSTGLNRDCHSVRGTRSRAKAAPTSSGNLSHDGPRKPSGSTSLLSNEIAATTAQVPMTTAMPTSKA